MITLHIEMILYVTGAITASIILQFFFPRFFLKKVAKIDLEDEAGIFYARQWGMLVFLFGALIICSAFYPEIRKPVLIAAAIEKAVLVISIFSSLRHNFARGLVGAAVFDTLCVILYGIYLTGIA